MNRLRRWRAMIVGGVVAALVLAGCSSEGTTAPLQTVPTLSPTEIVDLEIVTGQQVFVPAYSEIAYVSAEDRISLTVTLAIHNTDLSHPIIVRSVRYFDTTGALVREFVDAPVLLEPMATTGFVIPAGAQGGGWGSNFLVEWGAETPVYEPVIEAVMVSSRGTEGISFISLGRVVSEQR